MKRNISDSPKHNAKELATYLGINKMTIYRMVKNNKIPYLRVGTSIRFDQSEIDRWLQNGKEIKTKSTKVMS